MNDELDEALDLEVVQLRLDKSLVDAYKYMAEEIGITYKALMRRALEHCVDME